MALGTAGSPRPTSAPSQPIPPNTKYTAVLSVMSCTMAFFLENPSRRITQKVNAMPAAPPAATSWVSPKPARATFSEYQTPTRGPRRLARSPPTAV